MRVITVEPRSEASRERARLRDASRKRRWITGCSEARIMKSHRILIGSITIQYTLSLLRLGNPLTEDRRTAPSGAMTPREATAGSLRLPTTPAPPPRSQASLPTSDRPSVSSRRGHTSNNPCRRARPHRRKLPGSSSLEDDPNLHRCCSLFPGPPRPMDGVGQRRIRPRRIRAHYLEKNESLRR